MGWISIPSEEEEIIRIYSIADDVRTLNEKFFEFIGNMSLGLMSFIIIITFGAFIFLLFMSIRKAIKAPNRING